MKPINLNLNCTVDDAIDTLEESTRCTGLFKTYYTIKGHFNGNKFKIGIKAPRQILSSAYLVGEIYSEGNKSVIQAELTKSKVLKVPHFLLFLSAVGFACGAPFLAYSIFTLGDNVGFIAAVVVVSFFILFAGILQNIATDQQEELEGYLPKVFSKQTIEPNKKMKTDGK